MNNGHKVSNTSLNAGKDLLTLYHLKPWFEFINECLTSESFSLKQKDLDWSKSIESLSHLRKQKVVRRELKAGSAVCLATRAPCLQFMKGVRCANVCRISVTAPVTPRHSRCHAQLPWHACLQQLPPLHLTSACYVWSIPAGHDAEGQHSLGCLVLRTPQDCCHIQVRVQQPWQWSATFGGFPPLFFKACVMWTYLGLGLGFVLDG